MTQSVFKKRYARKYLSKLSTLRAKLTMLALARVGAGAAVTSSSGVEFGVLDLVVSTALSTGKTLDAAMSKTGC
tara:strand:- start:667 stop:888 length:222 start_codon:yes stop_codon:yes gene_type:complete